MLVDRNTEEREIKSVMPEGLSFFTQSSRLWRDWVKERNLCALCASVVNK
jgi:hypothetical protein